MIILVLFMAVSVPAFAISPEEIGALKKEWSEFRSEYAQPNKPAPLRALLPRFLDESNEVSKILAKDESISWEEMEWIVAFPEERFTDSEFDLAILNAKMKTEIDRANTFRYYVMELADFLIEFEKAKKREFKDYARSIQEKQKKEEKQFRKTQIAMLQEFIDSLKSRLADQEKTLVKYKTLPDAIKAEKVPPKTKGNQRERLRILAANQALEKNWFEKNKVAIQMTESTIEMVRNQIREYERKIQVMRDPHFDLKLGQVTFTSTDLSVASDLPFFDQKGMPVLRLLQNGLSGEDLREVLRSVGRDLFLRPDYFSALDDSFLERQRDYAFQCYGFVSKTLSDLDESAMGRELKEAQKIMPEFSSEHMFAYAKLIHHLVRLHDLEIERRKTLKRISLLPVEEIQQELETTTPVSISSPEASPEMKHEVSQPLLSVPVRRSPEYKGALFTVQIKKYVSDEVLSFSSGRQVQSFDELVRKLGDEGPNLNHRKDSKYEYQWRNFGALTSIDFHCHLGSSNVVAVWRVLKGNVIVIYYVGNHPTTYKRIVNKKFQNAF